MKNRLTRPLKLGFCFQLESGIAIDYMAPYVRDEIDHGKKDKWLYGFSNLHGCIYQNSWYVVLESHAHTWDPYKNFCWAMPLGMMITHIQLRLQHLDARISLFITNINR
jgi:hypothetical protein